MAFLEQEIDREITQGMVAGPEFDVDVSGTPGGYSKRNYNGPECGIWKFVVPYNVKTNTIVASLREQFICAQGPLISFRLYNPDFYSVTDEILGTGDGIEDDFQLIKTYTWGSISRVWNILKPITGTQVVKLDDVVQESGWTVNTTTGIVTFASPPGVGVVVKASTQFCFPVRFDTRQMAAQSRDGEKRDWNNVVFWEIIELEEAVS